MNKNSKECAEHREKSTCFTCPECDNCILDVAKAYAKLVLKDLNMEVK